jgi:hypothetical protein
LYAVSFKILNSNKPILVNKILRGSIRKSYRFIYPTSSDDSQSAPLPPKKILNQINIVYDNDTLQQEGILPLLGYGLIITQEGTKFNVNPGNSWNSGVWETLESAVFDSNINDFLNNDILYYESGYYNYSTRFSNYLKELYPDQYLNNLYNKICNVDGDTTINPFDIHTAFPDLGPQLSRQDHVELCRISLELQVIKGDNYNNISNKEKIKKYLYYNILSPVVL